MTHEETVGAGVTKVTFTLTFSIPSTTSSVLNSDINAQRAIMDSISQIIVGVTNITNFNAVSGRRKRELDVLARVYATDIQSRLLLASDSIISASVTAIPSEPSSSSSSVASQYSSDFAAAIDTGVFKNVLTNNVEKYRALNEMYLIE